MAGLARQAGPVRAWIGEARLGEAWQAGRVLDWIGGAGPGEERQGVFSTGAAGRGDAGGARAGRIKHEGPGAGGESAPGPRYEAMSDAPADYHTERAPRERALFPLDWTAARALGSASEKKKAAPSGTSKRLANPDRSGHAAANQRRSSVAHHPRGSQALSSPTRSGDRGKEAGRGRQIRRAERAPHRPNARRVTQPKRERRIRATGRWSMRRNLNAPVLKRQADGPGIRAELRKLCGWRKGRRRTQSRKG